MSNVNDFAHLVVNGDWTEAIQAAYDESHDVYLPARVYRVNGKIQVSTGQIVGPKDAVIEHYPPNDTTTCIVVTGTDEGRTKLSGFTLKGQQNGHPWGFDLIRVVKGDYVRLEDLTLVSPARDGVHVEMTADYHWVENMMLDGVKVQFGNPLTSRGRDGFHFNIPAGKLANFINQVTMINCETRSIFRNPLRLEVNNTTDAAAKIGHFRIINNEFAGIGAVSDPLVYLKSQTTGGCIENFAITDSAIEDTEYKRTGASILIEGKMSGLFQYRGCICNGTGQDIVGMELFPDYDVWNARTTANVRRYSSLTGLYRKFRTTALAMGSYEDLPYTLKSGEVLKGYIRNRYNNREWFAEFTTWGSDDIFVASGVNVGVTVIGNKIRVTNLYGKTELEIFLIREVLDTAF